MRIAILSLALAAMLPAQNLITNGDFEAGSLAGWTLTRGTPVVQAFATNGGIPSLAPVHSVRPPCTAVYNLVFEQILPVVTPGHYVLRFDYLADPAVGGIAASIGVRVGGNGVGVNATGDRRTGVVRGQYCVVRHLTGPQSLEVELAAVGCGSTAAIDNISVRPLRAAFLGSLRSRVLGTPTWIPAAGAPSAACYLLVGFAPAASPIVVPGFSGDLRLDPLQAGVFAMRTMEIFGATTFYFWIPTNPALAGVELYWQAAQLDPASGRGAFSWESLQPFWM